MKVTAIWERPQAHKRYGSIFILCNDGQFLTCTQEREFDGTYKNSERRYVETGKPEYGPAFDREDRFDFQKADFFIRHFGGRRVARFE